MTLPSTFPLGRCCALMVPMVAVGGAHLGWTLALAAVTFTEKAAG